MYRYFVSYSHVTAGGTSAFGAHLVRLDQPLNDEPQIMAVIEMIQRETRAKQVIPLWWQPLVGTPEA